VQIGFGIFTVVPSIPKNVIEKWRENGSILTRQTTKGRGLFHIQYVEWVKFFV
jgi:hypothetical protein